jgi:hypothetical protein
MGCIYFFVDSWFGPGKFGICFQMNWHLTCVFAPTSTDESFLGWYLQILVNLKLYVQWTCIVGWKFVLEYQKDQPAKASCDLMSISAKPSIICTRDIWLRRRSNFYDEFGCVNEHQTLQFYDNGFVIWYSYWSIITINVIRISVLARENIVRVQVIANLILVIQKIIFQQNQRIAFHLNPLKNSPAVI